MNDNIYFLSDASICEKLGAKLRARRIRQNISQKDLAEATCVSLSSIIKIEKGQIGNFENLLRVIRELRCLELFELLLNEEGPTPQEEYELKQKLAKRLRKRAGKKHTEKKIVI